MSGRKVATDDLPALLLRSAVDVTIAKAQVAELVHQAREVGMTWDTIGKALGVSRQAAQQRWGR